MEGEEKGEVVMVSRTVATSVLQTRFGSGKKDIQLNRKVGRYPGPDTPHSKLKFVSELSCL